jgi:hypothetical protein
VILYFLITAAILSAWTLLRLTGSERERLQREAVVRQKISAAAERAENEGGASASNVTTPVGEKGKH